MGSSIRERQISLLKQMINCNQPITKSSSMEPSWKILVYDKYGQDIISPILSVKELQELGVTLHVQLHSPRDPVPEVPAIYFCLPTEENLGRINQDLNNQLYESYYFNFISSISRHRLEDLASAAINAQNVAQVLKVCDQYLNFISLEDDLFILRNQKSDMISYYSMNKGDITDTEMDNILDGIVDSLFSLFATLGTVPFIQSPKGNAAEMVAEKLDKKLRESLRDTRSGLFTSDLTQTYGFHRPLLVLLDRNMDMATPLHHTWTYQALLHDVLDLNLNRVVVNEPEPNDNRSPDSHRSHGPAYKPKTKSCDLNPTDKFWVSHRGSPFPTVAESIQEDLEEYKASEGQVKRLKESMDQENDAAMSLVSNTTAKLTSAVSSLPQLLERKRLLDMHTTIATAVLEEIKLRKLDVFLEVEEKVMSKAALDRSVLDIISDPECGTADDKLRLFLIYFICSPNMTEAETDQYAAALTKAGCNLHALRYLKRWKTCTKIVTSSSQYLGGGTRTVNMFAKLVSQGSNFVMEGVKNLVVKKHNLPVTRIVDHLMELKPSPETDDFRYFDPKLLKPTELGSSSAPRNRAPYQDAIVFMVGGGNYSEYQNLVDYAKSKTGGGNVKRIVYGCSTLNNGNQFLKQLVLLGEEMGATDSLL